MGANAAPEHAANRVRIYPRSFKALAKLSRFVSAHFRPDPRLVVLCTLLIFPLCIFAQVNFEDLRAKLLAGSVEEKRNALFEIRNLRTEEASRLAIPALSDGSEIVRATAVSSVTFLPQDEALKLLLPLLNDKAPFVRRETAFALGEIGNASAVAALIQDLKKEKDVENRSAAAMALGKLGDASAIEPLLTILKNKPSEDEEFVRGSAARSIGEIAQTMRFGKRQKLVPQNFLPEKYKDKLVPVNPQSAQTSPILGSAIAVLSKVIENSREADDTRREAAFALGAIGSPATIQLLRSHENSEDPYLAEICKEALLSFPPPG